MNVAKNLSRFLSLFLSLTLTLPVLTAHPEQDQPDTLRQAGLEENSAKADFLKQLGVIPNVAFPTSSSGLEEVDPQVKELLSVFEAQTNRTQRLQILADRLPPFPSQQRVQFLEGLLWTGEMITSEAIMDAFTQDNPSSRIVRDQILLAVSEDPTGNSILVLSEILARLPNLYDLGEFIGRAINSEQLPSEIRAGLFIFMNEATYESSIRKHEAIANLIDLEPYKVISDLFLSKAKMYEYMGEDNELVAGISSRERIFSFFSLAIAGEIELPRDPQTGAANPEISSKYLELRKMIKQKAQKLYQELYEGTDLILNKSTHPIFHLMAFRDLIRLENFYGIYQTLGPSEENGIQHFTIAQTLQARFADLKVDQKRRFGISTGLEEKDLIANIEDLPLIFSWVVASYLKDYPDWKHLVKANLIFAGPSGEATAELPIHEGIPDEWPNLVADALSKAGAQKDVAQFWIVEISDATLAVFGKTTEAVANAEFREALFPITLEPVPANLPDRPHSGLEETVATALLAIRAAKSATYAGVKFPGGVSDALDGAASALQESRPDVREARERLVNAGSLVRSAITAGSRDQQAALRQVLNNITTAYNTLLSGLEESYTVAEVLQKLDEVARAYRVELGASGGVVTPDLPGYVIFNWGYGQRTEYFTDPNNESRIRGFLGTVASRSTLENDEGQRLVLLEEKESRVDGEWIRWIEIRPAKEPTFVEPSPAASFEPSKPTLAPELIPSGIDGLRTGLEEERRFVPLEAGSFPELLAGFLLSVAQDNPNLTHIALNLEVAGGNSRLREFLVRESTREALISELAPILTALGVTADVAAKWTATMERSPVNLVLGATREVVSAARFNRKIISLLLTPIKAASAPAVFSPEGIENALAHLEARWVNRYPQIAYLAQQIFDGRLTFEQVIAELKTTLTPAEASQATQSLATAYITAKYGLYALGAAAIDLLWDETVDEQTVTLYLHNDNPDRTAEQNSAIITEARLLGGRPSSPTGLEESGIQAYVEDLSRLSIPGLVQGARTLIERDLLGEQDLSLRESMKSPQYFDAALEIIQAYENAAELNPQFDEEQIHQLMAFLLQARIVRAREYAQNPDVREALESNQGQLKLSAQVAGNLSGIPDALGGVLLTRQETSFDTRSGIVIMDSDLSNKELERHAAVIKPGSTAQEVFQALKLLGARTGDLIVFEKGVGLSSSPGEVRQQMLKHLGRSDQLPRALVAGKQQIDEMPVIAFQILANQEGLPDVVMLGIAFKFRGQWDQEYSLIVWKQA